MKKKAIFVVIGLLVVCCLGSILYAMPTQSGYPGNDFVPALNKEPVAPHIEKFHVMESQKDLEILLNSAGENGEIAFYSFGDSGLELRDHDFVEGMFTLKEAKLGISDKTPGNWLTRAPLEKLGSVNPILVIRYGLMDRAFYFIAKPQDHKSEYSAEELASRILAYDNLVSKDTPGRGAEIYFIETSENK